ncbi:ParB/RepB/Spo0J family partition protein [Streptomyces hygroscopicus]|uniref:ParB/RepB/Spo0J family partition protein n=1 Tax=Streptomyces hygroscopicus TaxID=1912 RepID=UPI00367744E8
MTKADEMGESSAFSRAGSARSARGRAIRSALDGADPTQLALHLLSHNPDNPREELGDVTELAGSLRDHGQKQALSIMTRDAYLAANPEREDELETHAMYVVIDGNRRLAAAREAGLSSLKVMVDDSATDTSELLESALVANIHRQAFEPLDEAKALKQLLEIHGTHDKLAKRLHRSQGWVSQRLALLDLTPELKQSLENGSEPLELLRRVGKKPPDQQRPILEELKAKKAAADRAKRPSKAPAPEPALAPVAPVEPMPVQRDSSRPAVEPAQASAPSPEKQETAAADGEPHYAVMKQRPERDDAVPAVAVVMPWGNWSAVLQILRERMEPADLEQLAKEVLG